MKRRLEVLVIDADPQLGPLTAQWLGQRGAAVTLVASVAEALERGGRWDALLLDDSCGLLDARSIAGLHGLAARFVVSGSVPGVQVQLSKPHAFDRLAELVLGELPRRRAAPRITRGAARRRHAAVVQPHRGARRADPRTR
jgi:hypothetical protein